MPDLEVVLSAGSSGRCRSTQQLPQSSRQLKSARGLESSEYLQPWNTTHPTYLPHSRTTASREIFAHTWSQVGFVPLAAHRTQRASLYVLKASVVDNLSPSLQALLKLNYFLLFDHRKNFAHPPTWLDSRANAWPAIVLLKSSWIQDS